MEVSRRIALATGNTPGHFYPALAVRDAYRRLDPNVSVLFLGPPHGIAARLAEAHACPYQAVPASAFARVTAGASIASLLRIPTAVIVARRALRREGSRLVIGFGSYASGPVVLAGWTLGLGTVIHEANVWPGLANRWLGRIADHTHLNFAAAGEKFPRERQSVVGWPVRSAVLPLFHEPRVGPSAARPIRILVIGQNSEGDAPFLNRRVPPMIGRLAARGAAVEVRHLAQASEVAVLEAEYARAAVPAIIGSFLEPVADAYRWCDFVIARAGAGTIAELAVAGVPALLVPLRGAADDHQALNAGAFAAAGGGWWIREEQWDDEAVASKVDAIVNDPEAWRDASAAARRLATPKAAEQIVEGCESLMRGRW